MSVSGLMSLRAVRVITLAIVLIMVGAPAPSLRMAAASGSHADSIRLWQGSRAADPVVDGAYVQAQLAYLATRNLHREAGQDTGLSRTRNGHDEFAADWLAELRRDLSGLSLRVSRQTFLLPGFGRRPPRRPGVNLIVTLPGATRPREWVLLVAHYDGTPLTTQSAFDDGSGCAILLGVARAMAPRWRRRRPARTVAFVLFDGEEQGLIGSFYDANVYRRGAPYRIVALYNEEQNGVGYPIRPFGLATNPTLPEYAFATPQRHGSRWAAAVAPRFWPALRLFVAALVRARDRAFAALHEVYPRLAYRPGVSAPVFTPADAHLVPIADDTIGGSDEAPFERLGLPTATFVSNYDYYDRRHHPWSYPYDTARDTMALLERTASGAARPSRALAAALALPGQLTVAMLMDSTWGSD